MVAPVEVGFFSFTEVPAASHRAYNEWHQLDHLPAQQVLPGIALGERWVCTPACYAAAPVLDPTLGRAQYLTLYLMTEPVEATLAGFRALAVDLRDQGRFFGDRESHRFGGWRLTGQVAAGRVLVDPAVVPWRPAAGVVCVVEPTSSNRVALADLAAFDGVAGAWRFERDEAVQHPSWVTADERITVAWVDGDLHAVAASLATGVPAATHVAPYEVIRAGEWGWFDEP